MGIGMYQAPNSIGPIGRPPLIVFQILISSKGPLMYYSKLTHTSMHLASKHSIGPTLIHSIKLYHSFSNIYQRTASISHITYHNTVASTRYLHEAHSSCSSIKKVHHVHQPNQMHIHVIMHDSHHLPHIITAPVY